MSRPFRLVIFDGFSLTTPDGNVVRISNKKACVILAYTALQTGKTVTRERLAGLLWSERSEERARASLRQALKKLKFELKDAGFCGLNIGRQEISIRPNCITIDLLEVFDGIEGAVGDLNELKKEQSPERLLHGFESLDQSFCTWLQVVRQNWADTYTHALERAMGVGNTNFEKSAAEYILKIDPSHEGARRHLIRYHAEMGNTALALRQYQTLWDLLGDEYDMEPDDETQSLIVDVKLGKFQSADLPYSGAAAPDLLKHETLQTARSSSPILEIWNFVQGGEWNREDYIIDGFRRELIAALVRFREWIIVEGSMEARLEKTQTSDYRLEGSYLEDGGDVKLVITIREIVSGRYVWSEQLSIAAENWNAARQAIVRRVSLALGVYLSAERMSANSLAEKIEPEHFDIWLRGQALTMQWRQDAHKEAIAIFKRILREAPGFGRAYSSLVQIQNAAPLVKAGVFRSVAINRSNVELARKAVNIDPLDSRALLCSGWALAVNGQFDQAEINLDLARELNTNDHWTLVSAALGMAFCGNNREALALADQVLSLGPPPSKSHWGYLGVLNFVCERYEECVWAMDRADQAIINFPAWKAAAYFHLGQPIHAQDSLELFLKLARQSCGNEEKFSVENLIDWLLHCFPIKDEKPLQRLKQGVISISQPALVKTKAGVS